MGQYIRKTKRYNGKKYEATGKTEQEALEKLYDKIAAAKRGEDTIGSTMKVDAWFEEWMSTYKEPKGLNESTLQDLRYRYRVNVGPFIGKLKLKDVKTIHLQKVMNRLEGRSYSLAQKVQTMLRELFRRARITHLITWDPSEGLEMPKTVEGHRRSITDKERDLLLAAADEAGHGLWIRTMLMTGMRPGETAALRWSAVDFDHNEIHVTAAREKGTQNVKGPKTEAGVRDIPIHAELRPLLLKARGEPFSLVFPNRKGNVASNDSMRNWWKAIREAAERLQPGGLDPSLTAYCLRHTFCTDLQNAGVAINVAKDLMGHTDIQTTANIYTHRDSGTLHQGIALLDGSGQARTGGEQAGGGNPGGAGSE